MEPGILPMEYRIQDCLAWIPFYTWETRKLHILAENNFFNFMEKNESVVHVFAP